MGSVRVTVRIPEELYEAIEREGRSISEVVRTALEEHVAKSPARETAYDLAKRFGIIGSVKKAPSDLSTNKKYFRGFGN